MKIYKFPLRLVDEQVIDVAETFHPLCVQMQKDVITVWAEIDPKSAAKKLTFFIAGTGTELTKRECKYLGTVQTGAFVWHVYHAIHFEKGVTYE